MYRTTSVKTTWKLRLAVLVVVLLVALATHGFWIRSLGWSLVCAEDLRPSDAILVENFDPIYLLFERAAALQKAGISARVLIPTQASRHDLGLPNTVSLGMVELMARVARVQNPEIVVTRQIEPISLNTAYQVRDFLVNERLKSVLVAAPAFRSRRSLLVYRSVLGPSGIQVHCTPVFVGHTPENWTATWHGIQDVVQQFMKLQFYRFYVLPLSRAG